MNIYKTKREIRDAVSAWRRAGESVGVVPTMGALHEGHLSLVDEARLRCDRVIATIFVNPMQFGPSEDFDTYPRQVERDIAMLKERGCHAVFAPDSAEMFAPDFSTRVSVEGITRDFCGAFRPAFFDGVTTIVTKLFMIICPDRAVFGEKDFQQLVTIRRLVRDLDMPVEIIGAAIVREPDGLAMSSRNQYLSPSERKAAASLYRTLVEASGQIASGANVKAVFQWAKSSLIDRGYTKVDYFALADPATLEVMTVANRPGRLLAAAWLGGTRLIDNVEVSTPV